MTEYFNLKGAVDPKALAQALTEALHALAAHHVPAALCGGMAMNWYGSSRFTADVDLLVADASAVVGTPLSFGGVRATASNGIPVDYICRTDDFAALYEAALLGAVHQDGVHIITREHLAALKMVAGRPKDLLDFSFLVTQEAFDRPAARQLIKEFLGAYAAKEYDSLASMADWEKSRGETG